MNQVFINEAFSKAISNYLSSADQPQGILYNSFLVVIIRLLINIYSELDIVNPMVVNDEELLITNLSKYGYEKENIKLFLSKIQLYYDLEKENEQKVVKFKNKYFVDIQKDLIDMFIAKKLNYRITIEETKEFYNLLYTPYCPNPLQVSYNFLMAEDVLEIDRYFKKEMKENVKEIKPREKNLLNVKAYEILNYSMSDIENMDYSQIDKLNHQVYDYFKIRENAINKEYLLEKAIEAIEREKNKVTSGNGYVDILLIMSIICTIIMLVGIFAFIIV